MSQDTTYNGWTNFATWCVALWLSNEQSSDEEARATCQLPDNLHEATAALREMVEANNPIADNASLYADLLNSQLRAVNWEEITTHYREET